MWKTLTTSMVGQISLERCLSSSATTSRVRATQLLDLQSSSLRPGRYSFRSGSRFSRFARRGCSGPTSIHEDPIVVKPYTAVGLIPAVRGIRRRKDIKINLEHLKHRSEEHTSELQSRLHLVCRLLLEKKKKT